MVYLEEQSVYLARLKQSLLWPLLKELLYDTVADYSLDTHNANDVAVSLLICVKTHNKTNAEIILDKFSKRQLNSDSHWIYDNFIIFSIVCAVRKFNLETDWIQTAINLTYSKVNPIDKKIKDSFRNILVGNYSSNGDYHQISLVYQFLAKDEKINGERLDEMYIELWNTTFPFSDDDFLNVISLKAIEIAFLRKALLNPHQFVLMNKFVPIFKRRVENIANVAASVSIAAMTLFSFYMLWFLSERSELYPLFSKILFFLFAVSGFGVSIIWGWKKRLKSFFVIQIEKLLGYPTN